MLHPFRLFRRFSDRQLAQRNVALEQELRESKSAIAVLEIERDLLTAALERERQRLAADIKNEVARGARATSDSR